MKTFYDVQQLLKRYGIFIYTGSRLSDLEMMETELRELYSSQLLDSKEFQVAMLLIRHETQQEIEKNKKGDYNE